MLPRSHRHWSTPHVCAPLPQPMVVASRVPAHIKAALREALLTLKAPRSPRTRSDGDDTKVEEASAPTPDEPGDASTADVAGLRRLFVREFVDVKDEFFLPLKTILETSTVMAAAASIPTCHRP